jgi:hypothetical protein
VDIDERHRGADGDRLAGSLLQSHGDLRGLSDQERQVLLLHRREAFQREGDLILAGCESFEAGDARRVGDVDELEADFRAASCDGDARERRLRLIERDRFDGRFVDLSK